MNNLNIYLMLRPKIIGWQDSQRWLFFFKVTFVPVLVRTLTFYLHETAREQRPVLQLPDLGTAILVAGAQ